MILRQLSRKSNQDWVWMSADCTADASATCMVCQRGLLWCMRFRDWILIMLYFVPLFYYLRIQFSRFRVSCYGIPLEILVCANLSMGKLFLSKWCKSSILTTFDFILYESCDLRDCYVGCVFYCSLHFLFLGTEKNASQSKWNSYLLNCKSNLKRSCFANFWLLQRSQKIAKVFKHEIE